jgi:hypothetical protein
LDLDRATGASILSTLCFIVYLLTPRIPALRHMPVSPLYTLGLIGLGGAEACQILGIFVLIGQWAVRKTAQRKLRELIVLLASLIPFAVIVIFVLTVIAYLRARRQAPASERAKQAKQEVKGQAVNTLVDAAANTTSSAAGSRVAPV